MPINEKTLKSHLSSGALTPVYLIYGNDNFLKKQMVDRIIKSTVGQDDGFNVLRYEYGCNLEEVYEELCAFPIMSDKKCIVFSDFEIDLSSKEEYEKLIELASEKYETSVFVINFVAIEPDFKKSERAKGLISAVESAGGVVAQIDRRTREEMIGQLVSSAKNHGVILTSAVSAYLVDSCSTDVNVLSNELSKLCAFVGKGNEITKEIIDKVSVKTVEASVFDISEKVISGDALGSLKLLDELYFSRVSPDIIFYQIASSFTDMYRALSAKHRGVSPEQAGIDFKMGNKAFLIKKASRNLKNIDEKTLKICFRLLLEADRELKGFASDTKIIMESLILKLIYAIKVGEKLD